MCMGCSSFAIVHWQGGEPCGRCAFGLRLDFRSVARFGLIELMRPRVGAIAYWSAMQLHFAVAANIELFWRCRILLSCSGKPNGALLGVEDVKQMKPAE